MERLLCFDKPNIDNEKGWLAKHIKGEDEHIEIRKTFEGVQLLVVVYKNPLWPNRPIFPEYDGGGKEWYWKQANKMYNTDHKRYAKRHQNVKISMNGKLHLTWNDWWDLTEVVKEALEIML
jgi:hypothetical protein